MESLPDMKASASCKGVIRWGLTLVCLTWISWAALLFIIEPLFKATGGYGLDYGHSLEWRTWGVGCFVGVLLLSMGGSFLVWGRKVCRLDLQHDKSLFWSPKLFFICYTLLCLVFYLFVSIGYFLGLDYYVMNIWSVVPAIASPLILSAMAWEQSRVLQTVNGHGTDRLKKVICAYICANILKWLFVPLDIISGDRPIQFLILVCFSWIVLELSWLWRQVGNLSYKPVAKR